MELKEVSQEKEVEHSTMDVKSVPTYLFSETYCGGYSGEDPPLPIPNREVKLTIADGTAIPGGRVGSRHFLIQKPSRLSLGGFFVCRGRGSFEGNALFVWRDF